MKNHYPIEDAEIVGDVNTQNLHIWWLQWLAQAWNLYKGKV